MSLFVLPKKKAIRIINNVPYSSHTNDLFFSNGILKLADINKFQQSVFMYENNKTDFSCNHSYNTRTRNTLSPVFCWTSIAQHSLSVSALNIGNEISDMIKSLPTLSSFKYHLKQHFLLYICTNFVYIFCMYIGLVLGLV